ncbi:MAG: glycoside hydrolase family 88 protein [Kiritimatiellia bacterium]|nr:glycoside hydrolase family 88 protein [Kiritimatiellia bacterium]
MRSAVAGLAEAGRPRSATPATVQDDARRRPHGDFKCNFLNYRCGGNAAAWMLMKGHLPEGLAAMEMYAEQLMTEAPRDRNGIFCHPGFPGEERIWIDVAFAVTPFLLFAGLALRREDFVNEACAQTFNMLDVLRNPENGLIHQALNFRGPGMLTEDHWGRGNGWALIALTELVADLPQDHPARPKAEQRFDDLITACLRVRGPSGLWHQELTEPDSYVETSGSGLILYALGVGLETGRIAETHRAVFDESLDCLLDYTTPQGDVFHTCRGCLSPGAGRKLDYMARAAVRNDPHAFGPIILTLVQAHLLETGQGLASGARRS